MPSMPRPKGKARKIAFRILGIPANQKKQNKKQSELRKRLLYEDTQRVR